MFLIWTRNSLKKIHWVWMKHASWCSFIVMIFCKEKISMRHTFFNLFLSINCVIVYMKFVWKILLSWCHLQFDCLSLFWIKVFKIVKVQKRAITDHLFLRVFKKLIDFISPFLSNRQPTNFSQISFFLSLNWLSRFHSNSQIS